MKKDVMVRCKNAPKMERVIDLMLALAGKDLEAVKKLVREDFTWQRIGNPERVTFDEWIDVFSTWPDIDEIAIQNALSHGNGAMCEGEIMEVTGKKSSFCLVVTFVNTAKDALIKKAHIYVV